MQKPIPRILIGAFRGGAGKTLVSLGLAACWRSLGKRVSVFKKGPDYIDAAWLTRAAGSACHNLDTYLMGEEAVLRSFQSRIRGCDVALVEGNRGLFDGMDEEGRHSSSMLARLLGLAVVLVIDCTKCTRTVAALLKGCQVLEEEVAICGVILNRVGGARHEDVVRRSIERYCGVPVVGAIPRCRDLGLHERHLGLLPPEEDGAVEENLGRLEETVRRHVDLEALWKATERYRPRGAERVARAAGKEAARPAPFPGIRVGVVKGPAFHFYYPENLEALQERGAELVDVVPARDAGLPKIDALYIGGGFPETQAAVLADNDPFKESIRRAVEAGLPVYAECGGAVYLGRGLERDGRFYPFAGVFPVSYRFHRRPQGHGYTLLEVEAENPLFPRGTHLRGHEFHYAGVSGWEEGSIRFACRVERGYGFDGTREGLWYRNAYATFSHLHALGDSHWAECFLARAASRSGGMPGPV